MTVDVILNKIKYLRIHNVSIYQIFSKFDSLMNVLERIFLSSRKDRRKDRVFLLYNENCFLFIVACILETNLAQ